MRLKDFDYGQSGAHFIIICTHQRVCVFGEVVSEEVVLSELGQIAGEEWVRSADIRREIELDREQFVVMPNHIHGIVWIVRSEDSSGRGDRPVAPTGSGPLKTGEAINVG